MDDRRALALRLDAETALEGGAQAFTPGLHVRAGELLAGGGVRTRRDLERMRDAGCDGALVASALHAGEVGRADLQDLAGGAQSDANASR